MTERRTVEVETIAGTPAVPPGGAATQHGRAPWWLWLASLLLVAPIVVSVGALLFRAVEASDSAWSTLVSGRTLELMIRTLAFTVAVTVSATAVGLAGAWILNRTDIRFKRVWAVAFAMPLVIPSYVIAMVLTSATGPRGLIADLSGLSMPHLIGFPGAWLALTIATYPYVYLITAAALLRVDPALEEAARGLGASPVRVFRTIVLPQLRPSIGAGALLAALYTLSDFGAVSLMRFDAFTRIIYAQHSGRLDRTPAIVLSIVLIVVAVVVVLFEQRSRGGGALYSSRPQRPPSPHRMTRPQRLAATFALGSIVTAALVLPLLVLSAWLMRGISAGSDVGLPWGAITGSLTGASLAAVVAVAASIPIVVLAVRFPSRASTALERIVYVIFSLPHITVAIAVVAFTVRYARPVYQSLLVLVIIYAAMFLAQAIGPAKASLLQIDPALDDASRSLGKGRIATMARVTLPLMSRGLLAGGLLVFITALKELPLTLLLRPSGFSTLAVRIWSAADELLYARAASAALILIAVSIVPVYYLSVKPKDPTQA